MLQVNEAEGLFNAQLPSPRFLQCWQSQKNLISFIAPSHVEQNGHCTPHDLLFVLYLVFLEGRISSDVAAPVAPAIGSAWAAVVSFFFVIFLNSFPMSASERATSPPLFEPEEGNSEASEERDVF